MNVRVHSFREHFVARFGVGDRAVWTHGRWNHGRHNGRFGWWWWAGGAWYFYDAPVYPYPDYVSTTYYEDPGQGGAYWYWCNDPRAYYPYIQTCNGPWQPVPAGANPGPQGADQNAGPPPGYNDQNDGDNGDNNNGPPPGYGNGPNDQNGQPPGYGNGPNDQGGYGNGPDNGDDQDNNDNNDNGPDNNDNNGPPPGSPQ